MKNLLITLIFCLGISNVFSQVDSSFTTQITPQAISYKAIAYDSTGQALASQTITLRSGILKGNENGLLEFQETHEVVTSEDGYFSIKIGEGIRSGGVQLEFKDINWGADQYFLKMEIDAAGGYNFGDAGTEKICSVPYSFKSAVADSLSGMSKDSLLMILNGVSSTCTCTLQDAYDNGNVITINPAIGYINFVGNNSGIPFSILRVDGTGTFNKDLSYFYNANTSNTNASIFARTNGIGQGIFVQSDNTTPQINTALSVVQNNIGTAARFNNNLNSSGHNNQRNVIEVLQGGVSIGGTGTAHGGYFTIQNNTSTAAAVRGEIGNFTLADHRSSAHAQAGSFLVNMADNDATSLSAQTVGIGGAATFLNSKISNSAAVVSAQHNGMGNAGNFTINNTNSSGTGILVTNNGGGNDFVTNHSSASGSGGSINITNANNTNIGYSINHAGTNGNVFMVNQTNPSSNGFGIMSNYGGSNGGAAQFIANNSSFSGSSVIASNAGIGNSLFLQNSKVSNDLPTLTIPNIFSKGSLIQAYTIVDLSTIQVAAVASLSNYSTTNLRPVVDALSWSDDAPVMRVASTGDNAQASAGVFTTTNFSGGADAIYAENFTSTTLNGQDASAITGVSLSGVSGVRGFAIGAGAAGIYGSNPSVGGGTGSTYGYAGYFDGDVLITGELFMPGIKFTGALVKNESQVPVGIAPEESTESWITDYGAGQLVNGSSTITINSDYKYQVNTNINYHVFVQAEGDCEGLFVESKSENSFTIKESKNGNSNISFSYRIVAKRKHLEDLRMPTVPQVRAASYAYMQLKWPELLAQKQSIYQSVLSKSQALQAEPARTIPSATALPSNSVSNAVQPLPSTPPLVTPLEPTPNVEPTQGKD